VASRYGLKPDLIDPESVCGHPLRVPNGLPMESRILSKLTAMTLIQWLNQRNGNKLNNLKRVIA
jgi:hypothetical protein